MEIRAAEISAILKSQIANFGIEAQSAEATDKATQAAAGQIRERMHARMLAMRNISAPQARQEMMMAQMQDMTEMMAMMGSDIGYFTLRNRRSLLIIAFFDFSHAWYT